MCHSNKKYKNCCATILKKLCY
ncbi:MULTISPECIES: SEC-C metal-binding domain-containing protein [Larkinella]|uniref:Uncharacterized protein n=2 Tax=Larkinella TaxID=332157 RepID=A0A5N1JIT5_9BACT|nr:hypothetical protein F0P93_16865 [Larkinella humicola]RCR66987.1 hypothetical protein DUE52_24070 [Larkinella punicea]